MPKIVEGKSFFNLVLYNKEGEWKATIIEFKPSDEKWEEMKNNPSTNFQGDIRQVYRGSILGLIENMGSGCERITMIYFHCTCDGGGSCDQCISGPRACVSWDTYYTCHIEAQDSYIAPTPGDVGGGSNTGGGTSEGSGESFEDPTAIPVDPTAPVLTPQYLEIQRRSELWTYLGGLNQGFQAWARDALNTPNYAQISETYALKFPEITHEEVVNIITDTRDNPELYPTPSTLLIEKLIKDDELNPCAKGVMSEVKNLNSNGISVILAKLNDPAKVYNYRLYMQNPDNPYHLANTNWKLNATGTAGIPYNYETKVRLSFPQNATKLGIAACLIHETVHAYILSLIDDCMQRNGDYCDNIQNNFPSVWNYYVSAVTGTAVTNGSSQHEEIANSFVAIIAAALKEYDNSAHGDDVYSDLAWGGLQETAAFGQLSESRQKLIKARNDAENWNQNAYDPSGSGIILATPVGTPCQ